MPAHRELAAAGTAAEVDAGEREEELAEVGRDACGVGRNRRRITVEQAPGGGKPGRHVARSHETVMPDLDVALRQDMKEEAPEELVCRKGDGLLTASAERDAAIVERDEAAVRESDAMGVAAEIAEDLLGAAEGTLGVDDPSRPMELVLHPRESRLRRERGGGPLEPERAAVVKAIEAGEELPAEEGAEHANGKEKVGASGDPLGAFGREATAGHNAVDVGMEPKVARPRVQDARDPEFGAEPPAIAPELEERLCRCGEEDVEDRLAVDEREAVELGRDREDDVECMGRENALHPAVDPACLA